MSHSSPQPIPLAFEPDSVYIVFIIRGNRPCPGVFHHNKNNRGILAYADGRMPGLRKSLSKVFSIKIDKKIETEFNIVAAYKVASLHYHELFSNETFAPSELVDVDLWMTNVLRFLNTKWEKKKVTWVAHPEIKSPEFKELVEEHVPSVSRYMRAVYLRQELTGSIWPRKDSLEC